MMRKLLLAALAGSLLALSPLAAEADTYSPNPVSQDFNGSAGGWDGASTTSGVCVPALLCPAVATEWRPGGADGNGYISTRFGSAAATQAGTATSIWTSPVFTYNGLGGKEPTSVRFDMNILRDVQALLDASLLNDTSYEVNLVDQTNGNAISVVPSTKVAPNGAWTAIQSASVNPDLLKIGRPYKIRITAAYHAAATAVASGEVGYDNVRLVTSSSSTTGGPNGGSGITNIKQLRKLTKTYILPKTAEVQGHLLVVHLRCPVIASPKPCQIQLAGLQAGRFSKAATARKVVKLRAGKERTIKVRIKPAYVAAYQKASKIWTKTIVRVGKVRVTVRTRMKL
jgi:hypothetical protein